jgi:hypothetical protein
MAAGTDELRAAQYFAFADWPGYTVVNPTIASTRPGGPVAAAYATLRHLGDDGYLRLVATTLQAVRSLAASISTVDGLRLVVEPESTAVAFTSDDPAMDLFVLADELAERGWHTQPQLAGPPASRVAPGGLPRSLHLTVTAAVAPQLASFGHDLAAAVAAARALGQPRVDPALLELAAVLAPAQLTVETVAALAGELGLGSGEGGPLPPRRAVLNTLVEAAARPVREALFNAFLRLLQRPAY